MDTSQKFSLHDQIVILENMALELNEFPKNSDFSYGLEGMKSFLDSTIEIVNHYEYAINWSLDIYDQYENLRNVFIEFIKTVDIDLYNKYIK